MWKIYELRDHLPLSETIVYMVDDVVCIPNEASTVELDGFVRFQNSSIVVVISSPYYPWYIY